VVKDLPKADFRTKRGNSSIVLEGVDGRTTTARRFREIVAQVSADIGGDPTEAQKQLIARAGTLAIWCEARETELANGQDFNAAEYATISNALRRLLTDLGLQRQAKEVTSLSQYLYERGRE
jgi:hypothetical protein